LGGGDSQGRTRQGAEALAQGQDKKASMMGVKITPPPIPAITETMAIATLSIKNPNRINTMAPLDISPEDTCRGTARDNMPSPAKERITEPTIMMDSSQGDRKYLLCAFNRVSPYFIALNIALNLKQSKAMMLLK
jgi:hypothetical protein